MFRTATNISISIDITGLPSALIKELRVMMINKKGDPSIKIKIYSLAIGNISCGVPNKNKMKSMNNIPRIASKIPIKELNIIA